MREVEVTVQTGEEYENMATEEQLSYVRRGSRVQCPKGEHEERGQMDPIFLQDTEQGKKFQEHLIGY